MRIGHQIETTRQKLGIPVFKMCDILAIETELEYHKITTGWVSLTTYQKIMFVAMTECPLELHNTQPQQLHNATTDCAEYRKPQQ